MSISIMKEGERMGRGVPRDFVREQWIKQRVAAQQADTVAVIGGGPAGMLVAHAIALSGRTPLIFTAPDEDGEPKRSEIGAATYLHAPIPDVTSIKPDGMIKYVKVGNRAGYALKVYGDRSAPCSWDKWEEGEQPAWSMQPVYDHLLEVYRSQLIPFEITSRDADDLLTAFPVVFNTAPAPSFCEIPEQHAFPTRQTWVTDEPGLAEFYDDPCIVYDGTVGTADSRIRCSSVFGKTATEYASPPKVDGAREGIKVLNTNCDCHPDIIRAGRWGEWRQGVLVHHAWDKAWGLMFDGFEGSAV